MQAQQVCPAAPLLLSGEGHSQEESLYLKLIEHSRIERCSSHLSLVNTKSSSWRHASESLTFRGNVETHNLQRDNPWH